MGKLTNVAMALLLGVGFVAAGGYLYHTEQQATENAEAVEATVVSSDVIHERERRQDGRGERDSYRPEIEYRYSFDGETYTTDNVCPGVGSGCGPSEEDLNDVEAFVEEYPADATVTAYVPPDAPSNAYLVEGGSSNVLYLGLAGAGLVTMLLGVRTYVTGGGDGGAANV